MAVLTHRSVSFFSYCVFDNELGSCPTKPKLWRKVPLDKKFPRFIETEVVTSHSHGFSTDLGSEPGGKKLKF